MKLKLNKQDERKLQQLITTLDSNIEIANLYTDFLTEHYNDIDSTLLEDSGSYYLALLTVLDIDENSSELKPLVKNHQLNQIDCLNTQDYLNNPYYKNIKLPKLKKDNWEFTSNTFLPYEGFVDSDLTFNGFYEVTHLGYFTKPLVYPLLLQNNSIWMSITPHEINTMQASVNHATGNVLVMGLGLGYFAYMCSIKKEVQQITIIENDPNIITLFKQYILPQFENRAKITIIQMDAIEYLQTAPHFDYTFIDLWHNEEDGLPIYLHLKQLEKDNSVDYWIESSLLAMIRRALIVVLDEALHNSPQNYENAQNNSDKLINALSIYYQDYDITTYAMIEELVSINNLKNIIKKLKI
jgi:hypothetical protein